MKPWTASLALLSLMLAACTETVTTPTANKTATPEADALPDNDGPSQAGDDASFSEPPLIRLVADGTPREGYQGSYCWTDPGAGVGLCVDKIAPEFDTTFQLPAGEPLRLQLDAPLPDSVSLSLETPSGEQLLPETVEGAESIAWLPPAQPGPYILSVFAQWDGLGDVLYMFSIELK